jgi:hypothetical protein
VCVGSNVAPLDDRVHDPMPKSGCARMSNALYILQPLVELP